MGEFMNTIECHVMYSNYALYFLLSSTHTSRLHRQSNKIRFAPQWCRTSQLRRQQTRFVFVESPRYGLGQQEWRSVRRAGDSGELCGELQSSGLDSWYVRYQ